MVQRFSFAYNHKMNDVLVAEQFESLEQSCVARNTSGRYVGN